MRAVEDAVIWGEKLKFIIYVVSNEAKGVIPISRVVDIVRIMEDAEANKVKCRNLMLYCR